MSEFIVHESLECRALCKYTLTFGTGSPYSCNPAFGTGSSKMFLHDYVKYYTPVRFIKKKLIDPLTLVYLLYVCVTICCSFASPPGGDSFRRSGRDGYRDSYRERERGRYGGGYEYDRYGGSSRGYGGGDYYDRGYERYDRGGGGGYDRYDMRGYDSKGYDRYDRGYDRAAYDRYYDEYSGGGRYSDYRARSRSPARDYYGGGGGGRERGG